MILDAISRIITATLFAPFIVIGIAYSKNIKLPIDISY